MQAKLVVGGSAPERHVDRSLLQAVARAHVWFEHLASGKRRSVAEIAALEGVTGSKVTALLQLAFLSPELVDHIVQGTQPISLSAEQFVRGEEIPLRWSTQQAVLGDSRLSVPVTVKLRRINRQIADGFEIENPLP